MIDPLGVPWRRFRVLVQGLPGDSRLMGIARDRTGERGLLPDWYRQLHPDTPSSVMTAAEWNERQGR